MKTNTINPYNRQYLRLFLALLVVLIGSSAAAHGQADGTVKWAFQTGSLVFSSPAIGGDGTVYVGSWDGRLYAINPDGTQKWAFLIGGFVTSPPAIGADGTLYVGANDNNLYAINPDGTQKWAFLTGNSVTSSPAIGADGTLYVGSQDGTLYAVTPNGTEKWAFLTGSVVTSSPAIGADGTVYVGSDDNNLYAINPDGTQKWAFLTGNSVTSSPAIGADGTLYVGSQDGTLYAVTPNGTEKWTFFTGGLVTSSPAIGADGTVYIGSPGGTLYAVTPNGTQKWTFLTGGLSFSAPAIGADGTVYVGSNDSNLYAINPDGTQKWVFPTGSLIYSSPAIGTDGTVYVGSNDNTLYAINGSSGGLSNSPWPMFHHDLKHTGLAGSDSPTSPAKMAVFRNGVWFLDFNGNEQFDDCETDRCIGFGIPGDIPVQGDWNGSGTTKIGVFRNGVWFLDFNGNDQFDDCETDRCIGFGIPGDIPVQGDWNGSGTTKLGAFRDGVWFLDFNGNEQFDDCVTDRCIGFGIPGDIPVQGDWNGSGTTKLGVFRDGVWFLDFNGNLQFDDCVTDRCIGFGIPGDIPVQGDWNGSGTTKIGVVRSGVWFLDFNGSGQFEDCATDRCLGFGLPGDVPVTFANTTAPPFVITSLSTTSVAPLQLLTITGSGFNFTANLSVRFSDDQGFTVDVRVVDASATSVTVAVPPFIDVVTGAFASGTVGVQVVESTGGDTRTSNAVPGFEIQNLMSPTATPGYVSIAVLEAIEVFYPVIRETLLGLSGTAATDVLSALDDYKASVDELRDSIITVIQNPSQSVSIGSFDGTSLVLNTATLVELDRVMANFLVTFLPNSPGKCTKDQSLAQLLNERAGLQLQRANATEFHQTCLQVGLTESLESLQLLTNTVGTGLLAVSAACFFASGGACALPAAIVGMVGGILMIQSNAISAQLLMTQKAVSQDGTLTNEQRESLKSSLTGMLEGIYVPFITLGLDKVQNGAGLVASLLLTYQNLQNKTTTLIETTDIDVIVPPSAGSLEVSPATGLSMVGDEGGPFPPFSQDYTLSNTGGTTINYSIFKSQGWVSLSSTGGSLEPAASTSVTVAVNINAASLSAGSYSDTVAFTNTTNGNGSTSRSVTLTVNPADSPPPPQGTSIIIDSLQCVNVGFFQILAEGRASGPIGSTLFANVTSAAIFEFSCTDWGERLVGPGCSRTSTDPAETSWSIRAGGVTGQNSFEVSLGTEVNETRSLVCQ